VQIGTILAQCVAQRSLLTRSHLIDESQLRTSNGGFTPKPNRRRGKFVDRLLWVVYVLVVVAISAPLAWGVHQYWPRRMVLSFPSATPDPTIIDGKLRLRSHTGVMLGLVGKFEDGLTAFLNFEYLRSLKDVDLQRVFLTATERQGKPVYRLYLLLENDCLGAVPYLAALKSSRFIDDYELVFTTAAQASKTRAQTELFLAAYSRPVQSKLETLPAAKLAANVSRFILFKAKTDRRTREQIQPLPSYEQTRELAADIIAVAEFYSVPLELFLGVGAVENNYLDVRGDLEHKVWKRRAQRGDIVLKRRRGRVLVVNYSVGVWQITRETLRYAHRLYKDDKRDYSQLPERLRPPADLDLDKIDSHVLTTYAGLLLRDLLDRFNGDVSKAIGAYNGGPGNPNLEYAAGVSVVADYASKVLQQAALLNGQSIARTRLVIRRRR